MTNGRDCDDDDEVLDKVWSGIQENGFSGNASTDEWFAEVSKLHGTKDAASRGEAGGGESERVGD
jgi:hypothetical protein